MKPHPYAVVLLRDSQYNMVFRGDDRREYVVALQESDAVKYQGDFPEDASVYWCDTEPAANNLINFLTRSYPRNNYALVKTEVIVHRPPGELTRSVFTEQGFLPE